MQTLQSVWKALSSAYNRHMDKLPLAPFDEQAIRIYVRELRENGQEPRPAEIWNPDLLLHNARDRMLPYGWALGGMALRPASPQKILKAAGYGG